MPPNYPMNLFRFVLASRQSPCPGRLAAARPGLQLMRGRQPTTRAAPRAGAPPRWSVACQTPSRRAPLPATRRLDRRSWLTRCWSGWPAGSAFWGMTSSLPTSPGLGLRPSWHKQHLKGGCCSREIAGSRNQGSGATSSTSKHLLLSPNLPRSWPNMTSAVPGHSSPAACCAMRSSTWLPPLPPTALGRLLQARSHGNAPNADDTTGRGYTHGE